MTRINTNVSSLTAQKNLAADEQQLSQFLTRLSTGLRITRQGRPGRFDRQHDARQRIVSTQKAISNSQQADQMLSTADSALGQATPSNTVRGLVDESANTGR